MRLTQRAADGWESARFTGIFLASGLFCSQAVFPPAAANAHRWAATVSAIWQHGERDKVLIDCIAFMLIENNKILAEKRTLTTLLDPGAIAIPGGHVDPGETWEEALYREAREELAVTLNSPRYVCSLLERLSDLYRIHYYVVESWSGQIECHEAEALLWIPLNELERFDLEVDKVAVNEYLRIYIERE